MLRTGIQEYQRVSDVRNTVELLRLGGGGGGVGCDDSFVEGRVPEGRVCNVKNRNPRISASAMLETQFLFAVVLEITCNKKKKKTE